MRGVVIAVTDNADVYSMFFAIIRTTIQDNTDNSIDKSLITDGKILEMLTIAKKHDIAHLLALGLHNNKIVDDKSDRLMQFVYVAMYRYEKINYEFERICEALENAKIKFIPLKGSVMRKYYPEPWMRTSCDIDILIHSEDMQAASTCLIDNLKYNIRERNSHDVSFFSEGGVHLELHFDLVEDGRANSAKNILKQVWDFATPKHNCEFQLEMNDAMFYYYHIAHMAKHFETGGCGIRPFIDLWILDNLQEADIEKRNTLLLKGNLLKFANMSRKLCKVWFEYDDHDVITEKLENYIISGGVYGSIENNVKVQQLKEGGKYRYILSKVFLSNSDLLKLYPKMENKKILLPLMQVHRWINIIISGISPETKMKLKINRNIENKDMDSIKVFLHEIGL